MDTRINRQRLIDSLCDLAKIKSPSGYEDEIATFLSVKLMFLGLVVTTDSFGNVIGKLSGFGKPLILCAHMDTVAVGSGDEIKPIVKGNVITSDGTTILGGDNKDAVSAILEMLIVLKESGVEHRALEIVFTRSEEAISAGAKNLDFSLLEGKECIVPDHSNDYGMIVTSAPGCYQFEVKVFGIRCHVKEPEKGVSAAFISANAVCKMPLGKVDDYTTSNIAHQLIGLKGVIDDNERLIGSLISENRNTVPDLAIIYGQVRGIDTAKIVGTIDRIKKVFEEEAMKLGGSIIFEVQRLADGYHFSEDDPLILEICARYKMQNVVPIFYKAMGGSDANVFNEHGIHAVVISSPHKNSHRVTEYIVIEELVMLADLLLRVVIKS